ncbi:MAG: hypothetical protein U0840_08090 [Gemmataceae bacterium]
MLDGPGVVAALVQSGYTDVVWLPDSELGRWQDALFQCAGLRLVRVCREGEAFALAAGLLLGGRRPIVLLQCTGFFEAGDAFRNVVHDLRLPVQVIVGVRSWKAHQQGKSTDTCPLFIEPIVEGWRIPYSWLDESHGPADLARLLQQSTGPQVILLAE